MHNKILDPLKSQRIVVYFDDGSEWRGAGPYQLDKPRKVVNVEIGGPEDLPAGHTWEGEKDGV